MIDSALTLRKVDLTDQPHLLAWDLPDTIAVRHLCNEQNADYVNYRDDLLARTRPTDKFLLLDRYIDRELNVFRELCRQSAGRLLLLHEVDVLLAYLQSRPGPTLNVFWDRLLRTRHLNAVLWIVLPSSCIPNRWPEHRVRVVPTARIAGLPIWS